MSSTTTQWFALNWPLVLAIVGGLLSLIGVVTEKVSRTSTVLKRFSYGMILLGGILAILSATVTSIRQGAVQTEAQKKNEELLSYAHALQARTDEVVQQQKRMAELSATIAQKNHEIGQQNLKLAEVAKDSLYSITGGDSYCRLLFSPSGEKRDYFDLNLVVQGKYPVYGVSVRIVDVVKNNAIIQNAITNLTIDKSLVNFYGSLSAASKYYLVGDVIPNRMVSLGRLQLSNIDGQNYTIEICARNGCNYQRLLCRPVNGALKIAMRTYRKDMSVEEEIVEPEFPRDNQGKISW